MRAGRRDVAKEQFWRAAIAKQTTSGFNIRAFCLQHNLSESGFYAWRRELAIRDAENRAASHVNSAAAVDSVSGASAPIVKSTRRPDIAQHRSSPVKEKSFFVPVVVTDDVHTSSIARPDVFVLELSNGRRLTIPTTLPMESIAQLIGALELPVQEDKL